MTVRRLSVSFFLFAVTAGAFFFFAPHVFAQASAAADVASTAGLGDRPLTETVGVIINIALGLLGVIFLIIFIYAGFRWMTSGGDEKRVDSAKHTLINATIGIVIVLMAYGITTFILNAISNATGTGRETGTNGSVSVERFSGSLGSGAIQDHYPRRNATSVPRNTKIMVTFRSVMDPASITTNSVHIYPSGQGEGAALTDVTITAAPDGRTFVFDPASLLGSPTENVQYSVQLLNTIKDAQGDKVFVGANSKGYLWSFETGTFLDVTPPTVSFVTPVASGTYDQNILVQITFSEPVDPTSATGTRESASGFENISVANVSAVPTPGTFAISNDYRTVTFVPAQSCGVNSCGEEIFCLPGNQTITSTVRGATVGSEPPQATLPYDGVVDMAGNALDGNGDGTGGGDFTWNFVTTNSVNLTGPHILSVTPNITEENVPLDQDIRVTFDDVLMSSSVSSDAITLSNQELASGDSHEQWYSFALKFLTTGGEEVHSSAEVPAQTEVNISHGTFLESVNGKSYVYGVEANEHIRNEYQNCYAPAEGPNAAGGSCGTSATAPYCCNGIASPSACSLF